MLYRTTFLLLSSCSLMLAGCSGGDDTAMETDSSMSTDTAAADTAMAGDASDRIAAVKGALGMENMGSIRYSGSAWRIRNSFRQTVSASPPWPQRDEITNYTRAIDLENMVSKATGDTFAQNLFFDPPVAGTYTQYVPEDEDSWSQQLEFWLTPWGFVTGAEMYGSTTDTAMVDGEEMTQISWMSPESMTSPSGMRYTVNGYIDDRNLVTRVETWVEDAFMGDMHVENVYSDYENTVGLMVPKTMEQRRGGGGVFGVEVDMVSVNPMNLTELTAAPENAGGGGFGGGGGADAPTDLTQEAGEGVTLITGGYVSMVVEFSDHVAVFEAGQSEARGETILAETQALYPDKPIRYIINSHPHSDHTAGLIPFVREGAIIVTHANNVDFLDMALSTPRTLLGEETLDPQFMAVEGVGVLEDGMTRLELHSVPNGHTDGMLVGFLPQQEILFQADFTLPQPGSDANPFVVTLAEYVAEAGLEFDQYLAVHAAQEAQTQADLMATIGQ